MVMDQQAALIRQIDLNQSAACPGELPLAEPEAPPPKLAGVESRVVARFFPGTRLGKLTPGQKQGYPRFTTSSPQPALGVSLSADSCPRSFPK